MDNLNNQHHFEAEEAGALNLWDLLQILKANWYWFVLSVVACLGLAYLYLLQAPRVYTRSASVLIKEENQWARPRSLYGFSDDMLSLQRNVDNEVIIFKTYQLMETVARRLHLDVSYTVKNGLRTVELYRESPVVLSFPETSESQGFSFTVTPKSEKEVILSKFVTRGTDGKPVEIEKPQIIALNDTVMTPVGKLVVTPSLYYTDMCYGKPIQVRKSNLSGVARSYLGRLQSSVASRRQLLST